MPSQWQVHFDVWADDPFYSASIWVHGLEVEKAEALVSVINMLGSLGGIEFGNATMMCDSHTRPDLGWEVWSQNEGQVEVRANEAKGEYHLYTRPSLMKLDGPLDERRDHEGMSYKTLHVERENSMSPARASEANRRMDCLARGVSTVKENDRDA
jgi:hypothetical protein